VAFVSNPSLPQTSQRTPVGEAFRLWSKTYDDELNPLLGLEQRFVKSLLPRIDGMNVLDVGCGTGRWLQTLGDGKPAALVGVDSSRAMLSRAEMKCGGNCDLVLGEATALPVADSFSDLVLASFVLSYIAQLELFASELRRVTRVGACVFVTDVHPETATACRWKRAFHVGEERVELDVHNRSLRQIVCCFERFGFEVTCIAEPTFGGPERSILEKAGKLDVFLDTADRPPIYILQLRRLGARAESRSVAVSSSLELTGTRLALGADEAISADIAISDSRIDSIGASGVATNSATMPSLDLTGYLVMPGLINAHDHLEFGLFPKLGHGPYSSFAEWADDIHCRDSAAIERHQRVPKDVRIWWGAIRDLLSGVTTVCHHNPLTPEMEDDSFPIRVLAKYGWAHSVSMDPELASKFRSTSRDLPFIVHAGEGVGEESESEIFQLDRMHALDERTVIVHGLALGHSGMRLANRRRASLVWCPSSNEFLFGRTHTAESMGSANRVVLGSDSPLTAAGDLLDEIRFAHSRVGIDSRELYWQVTSRPAQVFRLGNGEGALAPGGMADLIAVRDTGKSPCETLSKLSYEDIQLVVLGGRVQLASEAIRLRLPDELSSDLRPLKMGKTLRWIKAPLGRLFGEAEKVLGCGLMLGGKPVRNVLTEWL